MISSISIRKWHNPKVTFIVLCLTLTIIYFSHLTTSPFFRASTNHQKSKFINELLSHDLNTFDSSPLTTLCSETEWQPGLIFKCDVPPGGVINIRNTILNCVRYTILAGATQFILPLLPPTTTTTTSPEIRFSHLFDATHFNHTLSTSCPHLTLLGHQNDLFNFPTTAKPVEITPSLLAPPSTSRPIRKRQTKNDSKDEDLQQQISNPSTFREDLQRKIKETRPESSTFSSARPMLVILQNTVFDFPLSFDTNAFISSFPCILIPSPSIQNLAAEILYALRQKHNLEKGWLGIHLSVDPNAADARLSGVREQGDKYLGVAKEKGVGVVYVSSTEAWALKEFSSLAGVEISLSDGPEGGKAEKGTGQSAPRDGTVGGGVVATRDTTSALLAEKQILEKEHEEPASALVSVPPTKLPLLGRKASKSDSLYRKRDALIKRDTQANTGGIIVETASSLLSSTPTSPESLAMEKMDANQLFLLDYLVLSRATFFAGMGESNFSWGIGAHRGASGDGGQGVKTKGIWNGMQAVGGAGEGGKEKGGTEGDGQERQKVVIEKFEDVYGGEKSPTTQEKASEVKDQSEDAKEDNEDGAKDKGKDEGTEDSHEEDKSKDDAEESGGKDEDKESESKGERKGKDKGDDAEESEEDLWKASALADKNETAIEGAEEGGRKQKSEDVKEKTESSNKDGKTKAVGSDKGEGKEKDDDESKQQGKHADGSGEGKAEVKSQAGKSKEDSKTEQNDKGKSEDAKNSKGVPTKTELKNKAKEDSNAEPTPISESEKPKDDNSGSTDEKKEDTKPEPPEPPEPVPSSESEITEDDGRWTPPVADSEEISNPEGSASKDEQMEDNKPEPTAPSQSENPNEENEEGPPIEVSEPTKDQEDSRSKNKDKEDTTPEPTSTSNPQKSNDDDGESKDNEKEGPNSEPFATPKAESPKDEAKESSTLAKNPEEMKKEEGATLKDDKKQDTKSESSHTPTPETQTPFSDSKDLVPPDPWDVIHNPKNTASNVITEGNTKPQPSPEPESNYVALPEHPDDATSKDEPKGTAKFNPKPGLKTVPWADEWADDLKSPDTHSALVNLEGSEGFCGLDSLLCYLER